MANSGPGSRRSGLMKTQYRDHTPCGIPRLAGQFVYAGGGHNSQRQSRRWPIPTGRGVPGTFPATGTASPFRCMTSLQMSSNAFRSCLEFSRTIYRSSFVFGDRTGHPVSPRFPRFSRSFRTAPQCPKSLFSSPRTTFGCCAEGRLDGNPTP